MSHFENHGQRNPAQELAQQLDFGNGREVANVLQDIYHTDRQAFSQLAQQINRREQNYVGDDLVITDRGQVFVSHHGREERVGQLSNYYDNNYGSGPSWNHQSRGHRNGGVDVDINIGIGSSHQRPWIDMNNGQIYSNPGRNNRPPVTHYPGNFQSRDYSYGRNRNEAEVWGTVIGGIAGGVIGHERDRRDTVTGALIGALGGNLIGRQIDRNNQRQREYRWHR